ncbi:hypothetical protein LV457_10125 [Mycobacterium sp. MYCO198283]|uniref:hypothetical protein n=1 Tax=Mycobacterium sp. MYCO198283 TaxID=2883505 RepID=UPI001E5263AB|nr:hypothetical protein [Mycobacterium sp. MYCO198283]MCG5432643.1 hypothetical protein [Mycobacterium sp. MYCO198283]
MNDVVASELHSREAVDVALRGFVGVPRLPKRSGPRFHARSDHQIDVAAQLVVHWSHLSAKPSWLGME